MPSLQVSVPGQEETSTMEPAKGSASLAAFRSACKRGQVAASPTQWSTQVLFDGAGESFL